MDKVSFKNRILEVGSIPLLLTLALSKCKYRVIGCDIGPERYSKTIKKTGLNVVKCNIETEKLPFADNLFDVVVFNELFEHLRINPIFTLSEVLRTTKRGGVLILSTPNLRSLIGIKNFLLKNKSFSCSGSIYEEYSKIQKIGHMGHIREYTTKEIIEFLENIGFKITRIIYRGRYNTIIAQLIIRTIPCLSPVVSYIATKP